MSAADGVLVRIDPELRAAIRPDQKGSGKRLAIRRRLTPRSFHLAAVVRLEVLTSGQPSRERRSSGTCSSQYQPEVNTTGPM